jgi:alpha-D-xyloside xylohydrolase
VRGTAQAAKDIMSHYVDATGHSPVMPEWAAGYWHSPMGFASFNQSMVIDAVDGLVARHIPTDLYVIDYFNWKKMGDYTFNPEVWPDPAAMVKHLASKGVRLMVSAWPYTLKDGARASAEITQPGNGVRFPNGSMTPWPDSVCGDVCYLYDPTSQTGRDFVWNMLDTGYVKYGVKNFWFDASEPESLANYHIKGLDYHNPLGQPYGSTYTAGTNEQVGMMFPWYHTKMVFEGLMSKFPGEVPVTLARSGWAGSQRWGASNWNGDLSASWENFQKTIVAGLNAQLSGLAWWTHDIGAIGGCDNKDPEYREMLVRWFQFGLTSPIFRQHGSRTVEPWTLQQYGASGEMAYEAVVKFIKLRYTLRNYTMTLMEEVAANGTPVNRPLSFDFPADVHAWRVTDQFMFGPRYMTAPVYHLGARARAVYFPTGGDCAAWKRWAPAAGNGTDSSRSFAPGTTATVSVPFDELAMFECMPKSHVLALSE